MFLFLVDGNRDLDDPTDASHAGVFRGFILRNSDVGAAALTLDVFLFRAVCGNHIIWGDNITNPQGQHIIWGDTQMTEGYHIIWGDTAGVED